MKYYIYIITNKLNTTFYIGVTNNLVRRMYEHRNLLGDGFSNKYKLIKLVYFEEYPSVKEAISREKQLKNWHRRWKFNLIKKPNPHFKDLSKKWIRDAERLRLSSAECPSSA